MSENGAADVTRGILALYYVALFLFIVWMLAEIGLTLYRGLPAAKPCAGCSDADLGLTIDPEPSGGPKKAKEAG